MTKFCPECGTKQDDKNHYCSNCGFDFSKLENMGSVSNESDDSSINVPIDSGSVDSDLGGSGSVDSKPASSVSKPKNPISSSNSNNQRKSNSTTRTKATNHSNTTKKFSNGFLSNLSFAKCFLALAVVLAILAIIGMLSTTQEPYSGHGLTSFMESSSHYDLNDFLEDTKYDNDYSYDYLDYGGDGQSDRPSGSLI